LTLSSTFAFSILADFPDTPPLSSPPFHAITPASMPYDDSASPCQHAVCIHFYFHCFPSDFHATPTPAADCAMIAGIAICERSGAADAMARRFFDAQ